MQTNDPTTTRETMEERLDRLEAMLVGVADRLDRLSDAVTVPLCLQERSLRRLERALDSLHDARAAEPSVERPA
ncbi:MAG: hypothetical protein Q8S33_11910 [Myxococcales bacterium]|nr:hypothetical protein [Myxococcales bacterium]MDP3501037.1 hypothetical protein [Myxococcales bacterium]